MEQGSSHEMVKGNNGTELGPEQEAALKLLTAGKSVVEVAGEMGIHRATLYRWIKTNAVFAAAYNQWHEQMRQVSYSRLMTMAEKAGDALEKALEAGDGKLAMRYFEKMGLAKERAVGPTEAEEVMAEREMEGKRKRMKRKKEIGDIKYEEMQAELMGGM